MTVISTNPDRENLRFTIIAEFEASPERIWEVWQNPRQLEKWWGPPTWPATFEHHDFREGGVARYFMTGPEGDEAHGYWRFKVVNGPGRLEFEDGFADEDGEPSTEMPMTKVAVTIEAEGGRTRMTTVSDFKTIEDLDNVMEMGMEEGIRLAMGQIDSLL